MATQLIGVGGLTVELALRQFNRRLIARNRAEAVFNRWGLEAGIARRNGKAISFRRQDSIYPAGLAASNAAASAPSALTEGTQPAAINASWSEVQATVSQYGQVILYSDVADEQALDDVMPESVENLSESMTDALDLVTRDQLVAGTNRQYASIATTRGGASGVGSGMVLNFAELREAKRTEQRNNVRGVRSENGRYVVIGHPDTEFDLWSDTNIVNVAQYNPTEKRSEELWEVNFHDLPGGFRWFSTTNARIFAGAGLSAMNVYDTIVMGEEWYGRIKFEAFPPQIIRKPRGSGGATGDPLNQIASVGWKASHTAVILDQARGVNIEHATSAHTMG